MVQLIRSGKVQSYFFITFGLFIYALGWSAFLLPSEIIGGGVTGIGGLVFFATGFPVGYTYLMINAVLVLVALRVLGARFGLNTLYGIFLGSLFFVVLQRLITEPVVQDQFMSALIGGMLSGMGIGLAFSHGGNSGGTDIIALIVNKYRNVSPGRVIMLLDLFIIGSSYILFQSIEKLVYGYVVMGIAGYSIDLVLDGSRQSFQLMVMSSQNEAIARRITAEVGRGVTHLYGKGHYTQQEMDVLLVIIRKQDKASVLRIIQETDPKAFLSLSKVVGVFGQNFDVVKL